MFTQETRDESTLTDAQRAFRIAARRTVPEVAKYGDVPRHVTEKVNVARLKLMQSKPFEAALMAPMKVMYVVEDSACTTAMTDCYRRMWLCPSFIEKRSVRTVMMVLAHEAYHAALMHGVRGGARKPAVWNVACDMFINGVLKTRGYDFSEFDSMDVAEFVAAVSTPPAMRPARSDTDKPTCMLEPTVTVDTTPEQIYDRIMQSMPPEAEEPEGAGAGGLWGEGDGDIRSDLAGEGEGEGDGDGGDSKSGGQGPSVADINHEMSRRVAQGALAERAANKQAGTHMDAWMRRMIDDSLEDKVNWKVLVSRLVKQATARDDYTMRRPSRRGLSRGTITPSLRSEAVEVAAACCDTSGSVSNEELSQYAAETAAIVSRVRAKETHVAFVDTAVRNTQMFKRGERMKFEPRGGGGTDFRPGIEWARNLRERPAFLVYFTDGYGQFPEEKPPFPVIVVLAGSYGVTDRYVPSWATVVNVD